MADTKETPKEDETKKEKKTLSLGGGKGTLSLGNAQAAKIRQQMEGVRQGGGIAVEVRKKRVSADHQEEETPPQEDNESTSALRQMTSTEREARAQMIREALEAEEKRKEEQKAATQSKQEAPKEDKTEEKDTQDEQELANQRKELEEIERINAEEVNKDDPDSLRKQNLERMKATPAPERDNRFANTGKEDESTRDRLKRNDKTPRTRTSEPRRRSGKITVTQVLNEDYERDHGRSLAAQKRAQAKAKKMAGGVQEPAQKVYREVVIPETITVQELANRMSERGADVIKILMGMGVMATINQTIDADTAELIVEEMGHKSKRVMDADIEQGLEGEDDTEENVEPRPPVVTIMGHVDHGKTSLLDALRATDVVAGEAGGITQHIGAYQVQMPSGDRITFLDTPGHAAFTEMRARGANVTDIVILVVSADDSVMPQTIEAIKHAKAAEVPIIVAINKIDKPDANPLKIKQDLLQHEIVVEDMGGDVQAVEVSALQKKNLDKLEEAILLQAEILELKANPNRNAVGAVVESKQEIGRGSVATVLVQRGTLKVGDIFVVGSEWGKVRALINDKGEQIQEAPPGLPVEVLGLNGTPEAGDIFSVTNHESKAREIAEYRSRKKRQRETIAGAAAAAGSFEELLAASKAAGERQILPVIIKADVHGSVEAITGSLEKMAEDNDEIGVNILLGGVGGITESDITLARASGAMIVGFNVRANPQAREMAQREGIELRYYNVIYNVIDDAKAILSGMLSPETREEYIGNAEIREVFNITKVGKIAGCMVTNGFVKRGSGVRLLRDDVVIHEGKLKTLKRFKDEVKEVKEGMECGMAFENYDDIKEGDIIECYEVTEHARSLD